MNRKSLILLSSIAVLIILVCIVPIDIPSTVSATGKIMPIRELTVAREQDGSMNVYLHNIARNSREPLLLAEFERGDAVSFKFHRDFTLGSRIAADDTIGTIISSFIDEELSRLAHSLVTEKASLALALSGEKDSVIEEYRRALAKAEEEYTEQRRIAKRLKKLHEVGHVALQEYEIAESRCEVLRLQAQQARAALETVSSGVKHEEIAVIRSRIEGIKHDIEALRTRRAQYIATSPIAGVVVEPRLDPASGTLLRICDTETYMLLIPVRVPAAAKLTAGGLVRIISETGETLHGTITGTGYSAVPLNGFQTRIVTAEIESTEFPLTIGALVMCHFDTGPVRLRSYLLNQLTSTNG